MFGGLPGLPFLVLLMLMLIEDGRDDDDDDDQNSDGRMNNCSGVHRASRLGAQG